eukprot:CAMPEP_0172633958 /NCGR_PEP_ID=MMETSP1068-20121228/192084_1 /TAXON_ID=35684 /ORGANISM="Pseudopedinella elastica, Strain CCMP716" /LENGTH=34 /DNA_ID= /DNA_START= /DNA_END= /DNA_ORIENTATION=
MKANKPKKEYDIVSIVMSSADVSQDVPRKKTSSV